MSPVVSLADLAVSGRTVLLRADFNVPLDTDANGHRFITDDGRIRAALPTIQSLTSQGAKVVILAHLGRPKGQVDEALSLRPIAARLSELLADVWLWQTMSAANPRSQWCHTSAMAKLHCWKMRFDPARRARTLRSELRWHLCGLPGRLLRLRWIRSGASGTGKRNGTSPVTPARGRVTCCTRGRSLQHPDHRPGTALRSFWVAPRFRTNLVSSPTRSARSIVC